MRYDIALMHVMENAVRVNRLSLNSSCADITS